MTWQGTEVITWALFGAAGAVACFNVACAVRRVNGMRKASSVPLVGLLLLVLFVSLRWATGVPVHPRLVAVVGVVDLSVLLFLVFTRKRV